MCFRSYNWLVTILKVSQKSIKNISLRIIFLDIKILTLVKVRLVDPAAKIAVIMKQIINNYCSYKNNGHKLSCYCMLKLLFYTHHLKHYFDL